jgi:ATP-dependent Clp protease adaptor protein ClpS
MTTSIDITHDEKIELMQPKKWKIVLHNDDVTPMDFVIDLLHVVFRMDVGKALAITMQVHTNNKGVAGVYPYEIAEQKYSEANKIIKLAEMSLKITLEEE